MHLVESAAGIIFVGNIFLVIRGWIDRALAALSGIILMILLNIRSNTDAFYLVD